MRHHYVPEFLLRAWAESSSDGRVETFRLDLSHIPSVRHAPRYTAFEHNLYALTRDQVAGMEQHAVETHFLRHVDELAAGVLRKLITSGFRDLSGRDHSDWARFLMSLRLRQPNLVQELRSQASERLEASLNARPEEYNALAAESDPPTMLEWVNKHYPGLVENSGMSFFHRIVDNREVGAKILQMRWWLWDFAGEQHELLISDHPCIFTTGIDDPDLVIALPIGPRKAFMATKSDRIAGIMRRQRFRDMIIRMNESSISQARVRIYARNDRPRRFISNRMHVRRARLVEKAT